MRKWPYLAHFSPKLKNKDTLYSPTFKVGECKVVLFFHFGSKLTRYSHFVFFLFFLNLNALMEIEIFEQPFPVHFGG